MVSIRGGVEAFYARDVDGGTIEPYTEVVVVEYEDAGAVLESLRQAVRYPDRLP